MTHIPDDSARLGRILLVEDDPGLQESVRDLLKFAGHQVIMADSGAHALNILGTGDSLPDIILSDLMMPDMDGCQLLERVRDNVAWGHIPFVFVSGFSEKVAHCAALDTDRDRVIAKPFQPNILLTTLARML